MDMRLPYTFCFCIQGDDVLMVYRSKPPNQHLWNGIGGKIQEKETPEKAVAREVMEEADIDLKDATVRNVGIVTWTAVQDATNVNKGMYAFIATVPRGHISWKTKDTPEGMLAWKPISWVCDKKNHEVVENLPHFFPRMLHSTSMKHYHCVYENGSLKRVRELSDISL